MEMNRFMMMVIDTVKYPFPSKTVLHCFYPVFCFSQIMRDSLVNCEDVKDFFYYLNNYINVKCSVF